MAMKEDLIEETSGSAGHLSEQNKNAQGSTVFNMVHIIAIGLPLLVIWLAQPGTSK